MGKQESKDIDEFLDKTIFGCKGIKNTEYVLKKEKDIKKDLDKFIEESIKRGRTL